MRQDTIDKINARMALAQERHGKFRNAEHVIKTILLELSEADYATNWQGPDRFVAELLDVATVAIRGVEQLSGAETEADAVKQEMPTMPDDLWIPAPRSEGRENGTVFSASISKAFSVSQREYGRQTAWIMNTDDARAIRDWLNQFIAASEAEQ